MSCELKRVNDDAKDLKRLIGNAITDFCEEYKVTIADFNLVYQPYFSYGMYSVEFEVRLS
jgi:hypothetical protein